MRPSRATLQSGLFSFILHVIAAGLLIISLDFSNIPAIRPKRDIDIVQAVAVDNKQVEQELQRLRDIEKEQEAQQIKKQRELEQKLRELETKTAQAAKKRQAEEKKLADLEKKSNLEAARRRKAEEQRKQRAAAEKQKQEEERKHKEAEAILQQELAEEQRLQQQEQQRKDQQMLQNIVTDIYRRLVNNFNKSGLPAGLECVLSVRTIPGGEVVNVSISQSSGSDIFDRRAVNAVQKASPLPLPKDVATFERLKLRQFTFRFKPEN